MKKKNNPNILPVAKRGRGLYNLASSPKKKNFKVKSIKKETSINIKKLLRENLFFSVESEMNYKKIENFQARLIKV